MRPILIISSEEVCPDDHLDTLILTLGLHVVEILNFDQKHDEQMDKQMDKQTDEWMDGRTNEHDSNLI